MTENIPPSLSIQSHCRVCGDSGLEPILNLGSQPLANSLKKVPDAGEHRFPLNLAFCKNCSLVQILETISKELLFKHYVWVTGTSSTAKNFAQTFFKHVLEVAQPKPSDLILEIASNDGTFLRPFVSGGYNALGVDPAKNICEMANRQGLKTLNAFWNREVAQDILTEYGRAKVIFARNVIPHVSDLHEVIEAIHLALEDDGVGAIEFHNAGHIVDGLQYDSIYHEHLCYFSIKTLGNLLNQFHLFPFHVISSPISGGAWIVYFSRDHRSPTPEFQDHVEKENISGLNQISTWKEFAQKAVEHKNESHRLLHSLGNNSRVVGFGSSARSSTYLNFCGWDRSDIEAIIDNNPLKQGLYSPGSSIPIVSKEEGFHLQPGIVFVLAWNFTREIIQECRASGYTGKFLIPFPNQPHIVEG